MVRQFNRKLLNKEHTEARQLLLQQFIFPYNVDAGKKRIYQREETIPIKIGEASRTRGCVARARLK